MGIFYYLVFLMLFCTDYVIGDASEYLGFNDLPTTRTRSCYSLVQPKKPTFSKVKYRLCERKCLEYLWELNNRLEERKRIENCPNIQQVVFAGDVKPAEYPHMGAVGWWSSAAQTYKFLCSSSLISAKFVLTAAHCIYIADPEFSSPTPSIVRFGVTNTQDTDIYIPSIDVNIKDIIVEPHYVSPHKYFDIALLELDRELKFNKFLQPACLWSNRHTYRVDKFTVSGWGMADSDGNAMNTNLKAAVVKIVKKKTCNRLLKVYCQRNWCGVRNHQICAGNIRGGADTCTGDSGGPLQFKLINTTEEGNMYMIIGVTSFGMSAKSCGQEYTPGIYTKVHSFVDWIESVVWPDEE